MMGNTAEESKFHLFHVEADADLTDELSTANIYLDKSSYAIRNPLRLYGYLTSVRILDLYIGCSGITGPLRHLHT